MTEVLQGTRRVIPLRDNYFCDGPYYFLTSQSLGGLTPEVVAAKVSSGDSDEIKRLMDDGVCIPICFPGDCAMDRAVIVLGDLTEQEEDEWIGKISWKLNIPCGKFIFQCGGGDPADIEGSVSGNGMSGFCDYFQKMDVPAGNYAVDVYAYMPSLNGNFFFGDDCEQPMKEWKAWFIKTRKGEELPEWLNEIQDYDMPGERADELVSYIVRLSPLKAEPKLPMLDDEMGWCTFEVRKPKKAPIGIERWQLLVDDDGDDE